MTHGLLRRARPSHEKRRGQAEGYFQLSRVSQWSWERGAHLLWCEDHQGRQLPLEDPSHRLLLQAKAHQLSKGETAESLTRDRMGKDSLERPAWRTSMAGNTDGTMAPSLSEYDGWYNDFRYYNNSHGGSTAMWDLSSGTSERRRTGPSWHFLMPVLLVGQTTPAKEGT